MAWHMACNNSYTVVIVPLQSSLYSTEALRFFHWLKKLHALEKEKDSLWIGLQVLEQARFWYQHQLDQVSQRHARIGTREHDEKEEGCSCALRSSMQRVNGSLGSLLNNAYVCSAAPNEKESSDWYLRWNNATLTRITIQVQLNELVCQHAYLYRVRKRFEKELSQKNGRISVLEFEKDILIQQQDGIQYF